VQFDIKGFSRGEGVVALTLEAASLEDATRDAEARGLAVLTLQPARARAVRARGLGTRFPLLLFSQELLALLRAGLNLVSAIETLTEKERHPETRRVMDAVMARLREGRTFSAALVDEPRAFPPLFVASVRAAERTGDLDESLGRYVAYQRQMETVRKKLTGALIYPVLLLAVGGLVTLFLLGYVVPRFSQIYADMGDRLPFLSRLLLAWGNALANHGVLAVSVAAGLAAGAAYAATRPAVRAQVSRWLWRLPAVGDRLRIYQFARFYRTLGMLLRGGTPLVPALGMTSELLHPGLRAQLEAARLDIREGGALAAAFEKHGLTTPVAARLLRVGERSGNVAEMMERIGEFCDDEIARWVEWFTKLFEPLLMALIGVIIGAIVVLMYLPIFELAGGLQ